MPLTHVAYTSASESNTKSQGRQPYQRVRCFLPLPCFQTWTFPGFTAPFPPPHAFHEERTCILRRELLDRPTVQPPQTQRHDTPTPPSTTTVPLLPRREHASKVFFPLAVIGFLPPNPSSVTSKSTSYPRTFGYSPIHQGWLAHVVDCSANR